MASLFLKLVTCSTVKVNTVCGYPLTAKFCGKYNFKTLLYKRFSISNPNDPVEQAIHSLFTAYTHLMMTGYYDFGYEAGNSTIL